MTILLALSGFLFVSLLVAAAAMMLSPAGGSTIERRLSEVSAARVEQSDDVQADHAMMAALKRLGAIAPRSTKELGNLRQRLVTAGYRGREALVLFFGIRLGLAVLFFALAATPFVGCP